jgi:heme exporter protein D
MNWGSLSEFIAMGGYGGYIWSSYGVTALIFVAEIVLAVHRRRAARAQLPGTSR